jgi:acylphosphatase
MEEDEMNKRVHVMISGRVQGVWFRANTKRKAEDLGLTGWVKNTEDGKVEAVFEGNEDDIQKMVSWCHTGSESSRVTNVEVRYQDFTNEFDRFQIVH